MSSGSWLDMCTVTSWWGSSALSLNIPLQSVWTLPFVKSNNDMTRVYTSATSKPSCCCRGSDGTAECSLRPQVQQTIWKTLMCLYVCVLGWLGVGCWRISGVPHATALKGTEWSQSATSNTLQVSVTALHMLRSKKVNATLTLQHAGTF